MLTRVGDFAQHQRMTQLLLDAQTRARATQVQIGTGKVAQRFREVAPDADPDDLVAAAESAFRANWRLLDGV